MQLFRHSLKKILLGTFFVIALNGSSLLLGQGQFSAWQFDKEQEANQKTILNAFRSGSIGADRQGVEKFFDNYYFARWTVPDQSKLGAIQGYTVEFLNDLKYSTGDARDYFLNKSFTVLQKMAADQSVTPHARYNAILTIGAMNQRDAARPGDPVVPYSQALPYLVNQYNSQTTPDALRVGALVGIVRHAQHGIADDNIKNNTVPELLIKIIRAGKPVLQGDAYAQEMADWHRLLALDGLAALKSAGARGEVVDVLSSVIDESLESFEIRCRAARTFGDLDLSAAVTAGAQINFQRQALSLLALIRATYENELTLVKEARDKERLKSGGGGASMPSETRGFRFGGAAAGGEVEPSFASLSQAMKQEVTSSVQRLKWYMTCIAYGLRGNSLSGPPNAGVLPMLPANDPTAVKINGAVREIGQLLRFLDDGPQQPAAPKGAAGGPAGVPPVGGPPVGGPDTARGSTSTDNDLKVTLLLIRDYLEQQFKVNFEALMAK